MTGLRKYNVRGFKLPGREGKGIKRREARTPKTGRERKGKKRSDARTGVMGV